MQLADDDMRSRVIASGLLRFWYHLYLLDSSISKYFPAVDRQSSGPHKVEVS